MSDIVAFIRACLDADEAAARAAGEASHDGLDGRWAYWPGTEELSAQHGGPDGFVRWHNNIPEGEREEGAPIVTYWQEDADHIARHDPARVLADVGAKRALLRWAMRWPIRPPKASDGIAAEDYILRLLAQPFEGLPGWDDAWKVER